MASDQVLADEILKIRKAIAELDRLIAKANPEQREKLKEIRLNLEMALEVHQIPADARMCRRASAH